MYDASVACIGCIFAGNKDERCFADAHDSKQMPETWVIDMRIVTIIIRTSLSQHQDDTMPVIRESASRPLWQTFFGK